MNIKSGSQFDYVQCDTEVPGNLREAFAKFSSISKDNNVGRDDICHVLKTYTEKEGILTQPRKMLISSYFLEIGTIITPLRFLYLDPGLLCRNIYRLVQHTPMKRFNNFVQSAVNARREADESPNSSVVTETRKLLGNSFYGNQIVDPSRHTVTKYLSDRKNKGAINNKMFKRLG